MFKISKKFEEEKQIYSVSIDAFNFHYLYAGKDKERAEFLHNSFNSICGSLKIAYRDMCLKYSGELPTEERFFEMLTSSLKATKKEVENDTN
jgi:hypothetical protein